MTLKQRLQLELNRQLVLDARKTHPLRQLFWECTLRCNMNCRHCGSDCKASSSLPDMPFDDFRKVLESVKEHYDSHRISITLSGGEPLMRPDLAQCARAIYEMEFPWGLVSNGWLMTPAKIEELLGAGLHGATISLDGLKEEHDWMRGREHSFERASEAIRILASEPEIAFDVVSCVNRRNISQLEQIKDYLLSLGVKGWRLFTVFPVGRAANDPMLQLSSDEFKRLMDFICKCRKEGEIHTSYGCEGFLGPYEGKVRDNIFTCQAGLTVASVLADGSISACGSIRSDFHQGNIYRDDFIEVWENRFQPYRDRSWAKTGKCGDCRWWRYCQGGGMHLRGENRELLLCHLDRL
ncbi:MAG: TIGR04133 family radical SAM/SPASM protein [Bacteroidales bacterium]|nr:TIGR04133 family radical SAM/SPASM protein [Bacteroidales bacterium]